jgi:hypothetical protein
MTAHSDVITATFGGMLLTPLTCPLLPLGASLDVPIILYYPITNILISFVAINSFFGPCQLDNLAPLATPIPPLSLLFQEVSNLATIMLSFNCSTSRFHDPSR